MSMKFAVGLLVCCAMALVFSGCEERLRDQAGEDARVSGIWSVFTDDGRNGVISLSQSEGVVTGTGSVFGEGSASITGTIDGSSLALTSAVGSYVLYLSATVSEDNMNGSWTDSTGKSGLWSATRQ